MMVFFVDSSTNMNDERVFLAEQPVCVGGVGGTSCITKFIQNP
jgi:hypothetical protein